MYQTKISLIPIAMALEMHATPAQVMLAMMLTGMAYVEMWTTVQAIRMSNKPTPTRTVSETPAMGPQMATHQLILVMAMTEIQTGTELAMIQMDAQMTQI